MLPILCEGETERRAIGYKMREVRVRETLCSSGTDSVFVLSVLLWWLWVAGTLHGYFERLQTSTVVASVTYVVFEWQYLLLCWLLASVSSTVVTLTVCNFCCCYFERQYLLLWLLWASVSSAVVTLSVGIFCCGYFERQYILLWLLWALVTSTVVSLGVSNFCCVWVAVTSVVLAFSVIIFYCGYFDRL